jgi:hypothetical protein
MSGLRYPAGSSDQRLDDRALRQIVLRYTMQTVHAERLRH